MSDWITPEIDPDATIIMSAKGFTNNEIGVEFLRHFLKHTDAGPQSEWKLLLMDNHESHGTGEFAKLANDNHILPFPLISHLTHCMQPLDVGVFNPYKHWHDFAIQDSLAGLSIEYDIRAFLRDLPSIREKTFKKRTIRHAFKNSGMWPINVKQCLKQLKIFNPPRESPHECEPNSEPTLPTLPRTSIDIERGLERWNQHLGPRCSSPSRPEWNSFIEGSHQVLAETQLQEQELRIHQNRRKSELERKGTKRQRICKYGPITGREALEQKEKKAQKAKNAELKKLQQIRDKQWRAERDEAHRQGVAARKQERERKKEIKALQKAKQPIPPELQQPISDPEVIWKASQLQLTQQLQLQKKEEEEEVSFIIDTVGDRSFVEQDDYIALPKSSTEEEDEEDLDSSNSSSEESDNSL